MYFKKRRIKSNKEAEVVIACILQLWLTLMMNTKLINLKFKIPMTVSQNIMTINYKLVWKAVFITGSKYERRNLSDSRRKNLLQPSNFIYRQDKDETKFGI